MTKTINGSSVLALVAALSACGSRTETANNAAAIEAINDMAGNMASMTPDPASPFAQSEAEMDKAMAAAVGANAADTWTRKMIEHHRGAVAMSRVALAQRVSGDVAKMAQDTIDMQGKEITALEKMVASGAPDAKTADLYRPAALEMHDAMMATKGSNVSESYLRKMLAHHKGAVAMSDVALANGATGALRTQIDKTKATQQKEITMVDAMLRGKSR